MTDTTREAPSNPAAPSKICQRHGLPFDPTKARGCTRCYEEARAQAAQKKAATTTATAASSGSATVQMVRTPLPKTWPAQAQPVSVLCQRHALAFDPAKYRGCATCYEEARARAAQKKAAPAQPAAATPNARPQQAAPSNPPPQTSAPPVTPITTAPAAAAPVAAMPAGAAPPAVATPSATVETVRTPLPKTWPAQPQPISVRCQRHEKPFDPTKYRGCTQCYAEARARAEQKKAAQEKAAQEAQQQEAKTAPAAEPAKTLGLPPLPVPVSSQAKMDAPTSELQTVFTPLPSTWPQRTEPIRVLCQRHEKPFDPTKARGCTQCYEEARARAAQKKAAKEAAARGEAPPVVTPAVPSSPATPSYQIAQPPPPPPEATVAPATLDDSPQAADQNAADQNLAAPSQPRPPRPRPVRPPAPPPQTSVAQGLWVALVLIVFTGFGLLLKHQAIYDETQEMMGSAFDAEDGWENGGLTDEELEELPPELRELLTTNGYVDDESWEEEN